MSPAPSATLAFCLPSGLVAAGVSIWCVRAAKALAARGRSCLLLADAPAPGHAPLAAECDPRVRTLSLPPGAGDDACTRALASIDADRILIIAAQSADAFARAVHAADADPRVRVAGVRHSGLAYDRRLLEFFEPALAGVVAVSHALARETRDRTPSLAARLAAIPNAVPIDPAEPRKPDGPPWRLLAVGRLELGNKRAGALIDVARLLASAGIDASLTLAGDGPDEAALRSRAADLPNVRFTGAIPPSRVRALAEESHAFLLASRVEGLNLAMLESMERGCVPIVTPTDGAREALSPGVNAELAHAHPDDDDDEATARALLGALERAIARGPLAMGNAARRTVLDRFDTDQWATQLDRAFAAAADGHARPWPPDRPMPRVGEPITVPPDAGARFRALIEALPGPVALHGSGAHTRALAQQLAGVVALADDNPAAVGSSVAGIPVVGPAALSTLGVRDVIISSWIHQDDIWARRSMYESQGIRVHRLYD